MRRSIALLPLLLLLTLLQGCGFQLRGAAKLPAEIGPVLIHGLPAQDTLYRELSQLLGEGAVGVTREQAQAGSLLRILKRNSHRRVLSVDSHGKVAEYELAESAEFDLVDAKRKGLVPPQTVLVVRSYTNTEQQVLGKEQEEAMIREEMRRDLAGQIIRRIEAGLRH